MPSENYADGELEGYIATNVQTKNAENNQTTKTQTPKHRQTTLIEINDPNPVVASFCLKLL